MFELIDADIEVMYHLAELSPQRGVLVDEYFLGLVFEEILHPRDVDLLAVLFLVFDLGEVEGHGLESAGVDSILAGDLVET